MKKILLLFLLLLMSIYGLAQNPNPIETLENTLKTAKDTNLVNVLTELCRAYGSSDVEKANSYAMEALVEAKKIQFSKGEGHAYSALGAMALKKGNIKKAFEYQEKALKIREDIKDKKGISQSLNNLGSLYHQQSDFPTALEYYLKSLTIREEMKDKKGVMVSLNNIAQAYTAQADRNINDSSIYHKAKNYYLQALDLSKELKDLKTEGTILHNLGQIYDQKKDYNKALDYYLKAENIRLKINDLSGLGSSYYVIGNAYSSKQQYEKAVEYTEKALEVANKIGDKLIIAKSRYSLGNIYFDKNNIEKSFEETQISLKIANEINSLNDIMLANDLLYQIYKKQGNYPKALECFEKYKTLHDSIFNENSTKSLSGLQNRFELANKQKEVALNQAKFKGQQIFNYALIAGLGLVFILAIVLFRGQQRQKKANKEISFQKTQSDKLLRNILPDEVADELKEKGKATAHKYEKVSVLFTDFKGFTSRTEKMQPEEVIEELNKCFSKFDEIIEKYNLEKIKTIGDAYMCAGGLPVANDTNPIDAIKAGLEIQKYMIEYKNECIKNGEAYFQCRLGINTGSVVAGVVGRSKFAYDIWGDTVNTASRAESGGEPEKVNITENTYLLVKDYFECEYRGEIEAKGKGKIKMYFVNGAK
ncbi:MAG: hypothetical protein EAZ85_12415 [Bacteroidetes bacterium]|nr:MAG: hypothetical protein EAZ85_12415 [Bacteroidota bacterium]